MGMYRAFVEMANRPYLYTAFAGSCPPVDIIEWYTTTEGQRWEGVKALFNNVPYGTGDATNTANWQYASPQDYIASRDLGGRRIWIRYGMYDGQIYYNAGPHAVASVPAANLYLGEGITKGHEELFDENTASIEGLFDFFDGEYDTVKSPTPKTHTLDAIVKGTNTISPTILGIVSARTEKTADLSGIVVDVKSIQNTLDGYIADRYTKTHTIVSDVNARLYATNTIDGLTVETKTFSNTITAYVNEAPNRIFSSGFEDSDFAQWIVISGSPALTNFAGDVGNAFRCQTTGTVTITKQLYATNQSKAVYVRFKFRMNQLPSANTQIFRMLNASGSICGGLKVDNLGRLTGKMANSNDGGGSSNPLSLNTWYRIDFMMDSTTTPGTMSWAIDGVVISSYENSSQAPWARINIGSVNTSNIHQYLDDVAVDEATGWINDGRTDNIAQTLDGIVLEVTSKPYGIDGIIAEITTAEYTMDAIIFATYTSTNLIDGLVQSDGEIANGIDGIVFETITKPYYIIGNIIEILTKTVALSASVRDTFQATHTIDGIVKVSTIATAAVNGIVKESFTSSNQITGLILATSDKAYAVDGIIGSRVNKAYGLDSFIGARTYLQHQLDLIIKSGDVSVSHELDSIVKQTLQATNTIVGTVVASYTTSATLDGWLVAVYHKFHTIDGIVAILETTRSFDTDGIVVDRVEISNYLDAEVINQYDSNHQLEGIVVDVRSTDIEADGIVSLRIENTHTLDAILVEKKTVAITIDAEVKTELYDKVRPYAKVIRRL